MAYMVSATLPADGLDGIRAGQVYERRLFSADQLAVLRELWSVRAGTVQDGKYKGTEIVQFNRKGFSNGR
jgi:hypothetical protein